MRKEWLVLSQIQPPVGAAVFFLWTSELEYGRIESGYKLKRLSGEAYLSYTFNGSIAPTHWLPGKVFPPIPPLDTGGDYD